MHYRSRDRIKEKLKKDLTKYTIEPAGAKGKDTNQEEYVRYLKLMGSSKGLTALDAEQVALMYKCAAKKQTSRWTDRFVCADDLRIDGKPLNCAAYVAEGSCDKNAKPCCACSKDMAFHDWKKHWTDGPPSDLKEGDYQENLESGTSVRKYLSCY